MSKLFELLRAVEAGIEPNWTPLVGYSAAKLGYAERALAGDLEAAETLYDTLLPDCSLFVGEKEICIKDTFDNVIWADNTACGWLRAILWILANKEVVQGPIDKTPEAALKVEHILLKPIAWKLVYHKGGIRITEDYLDAKASQTNVGAKIIPLYEIEE